MAAIHFPEAGKITQLYQDVELFSIGDPPRHTLFVLGRQPFTQLHSVEQLSQIDQGRNHLLLIDPPADAAARFRLEEEVVALFTGDTVESSLPVLATKAGGVAHLRIGEQFLDIYSQLTGSIIHLPALGIICGGSFGSDAVVPRIADGSGGDEELDTLRLLAQLVKRGRLQLYIPQIGSLATDMVDVMKRLAADVSYLHGLRRVIPAAVQRGDDLDALLSLADTLLPDVRHAALSEGVHLENIQTLFLAQQI